MFRFVLLPSTCHLFVSFTWKHAQDSWRNNLYDWFSQSLIYSSQRAEGRTEGSSSQTHRDQCAGLAAPTSPQRGICALMNTNYNSLLMGGHSGRLETEPQDALPPLSLCARSSVCSSFSQSLRFTAAILHCILCSDLFCSAHETTNRCGYAMDN